MASPTEKGFFTNVTDGISCRRVLNIMVFFGFMVNYMLRVNLTIAIVDMVVPGNKTNTENLTNFEIGVSQCGHQIEHKVSNVTTVIKSEVQSVSGVKFDWDEYVQNLILGSFYWGYVCTELPGGRLAEIIGARRVFGYSMLFSSIVTLLTPLSASIGYATVIVLRVVLGFLLGVTWPAVHPMAAHWIPPLERSKFIANMMASSLGAAFTLPVCGYLIAWFGWTSVFYVTGTVGFVWSVMWFLVVFDTPADHPRITPEERSYIEEAVGAGTTTSHKVLRVPWLRVLTSPPVWAIIITHGCSVFGFFSIVNQLPTYMKYILAFNIKENGLLSSLPYLGKYLMAAFTSYIADWLRATEKLSTTAIRKLFTTIAVLLPGLLMILMIFYGCDRVGSVAIFTIALTINGAVTAGYLGNGLDIAPNFSGTIFGMANTLSSFGGFVSAYMVGSLTYNNQTYGQWQKVFGVLAATYTIGGLTFLIFGTGKLQSWNSPAAPQTERKNDVELTIKNKETIPLKKK
ncbi:sialin [Lycorma delicatula]|uniref:sialin n=1 Tax=Lycorma delicatula TaxID=130591 RepID=UPI003F50DE76